jgi:predicted dehydrogenase
MGLGANRRGFALSCGQKLVYKRALRKWAETRALVREGVTGEPRYMQVPFSYFNADPHNVRNRPEAGGGAVRALAAGRHQGPHRDRRALQRAGKRAHELARAWHGRADRAPSSFTVPVADQYQLQMESFSRAVRSEAPDGSGQDDALANMRVIEALFAAEKSGRFERH